jgi:hypothetical protein
VITGTPQEGLVRQVPLTIEKVKSLAAERPITVFDREGWSPQLFATLGRNRGRPLLTYRKAAKGKRLPRLAEQLFTPRTIEVNGREVILRPADTQVGYRIGRQAPQARRTASGHAPQSRWQADACLDR